MLIKIFLVLIVSVSSVHASFDYNKYLKSETRTQIKLQKLVEDVGDYAEAIKFGKMGYDKYHENIFIMSYYAKAMYLSGDLGNSKIIFMKVLAKDPANDLAAEFVKKIEEQEAAKTNKDLENTLGYLSDKGLDFLMIFLGFLGAEVLARRYAKCASSSNKENIDRYIWVNKKVGSIQLFIIKNYIKEIITKPVCFSLQLIILITIAAAITLVINWFDLMGYLEFLKFVGFLSEDRLKIINAQELWIHFLWTLVIVLLAMVLINVYKLFKSLSKDEVKLFDVANELQTIALENDFELLKDCLETLRENDIDIKDILDYCVSDEASKVISKLTELSKKDGAYPT